jgi:hypothetical protein
MIVDGFRMFHLIATVEEKKLSAEPRRSHRVSPKEKLFSANLGAFGVSR